MGEDCERTALERRKPAPRTPRRARPAPVPWEARVLLDELEKQARAGPPQCKRKIQTSQARPEHSQAPPALPAARTQPVVPGLLLPSALPLQDLGCARHEPFRALSVCAVTASPASMSKSNFRWGFTCLRDGHSSG
uniref:Uncharacterized protein n=1 Tax=Rousettus aegyptiacus TaxID=9407 RepID=A0A7J8BAI0_ROUAE|nr:hypothetical protein HJG63_010007 [Rousettus aegyptiacus]